jgi:hypothetical protein
MAIIKNFSDFNGETVEIVSRYLIPIDNKEYATLFPGVKGRRCDSFSRYAGRDAEGRLLPVTRSIERKARPSMHKCDARCTEAKGHKCECSCNGKNHGKGQFICQAA